VVLKRNSQNGEVAGQSVALFTNDVSDSSLNLNPIAKTRIETLLKFIKARNAHVTGRPVDFLHPSAGADTPPCPEVVPGIMHTCQKVGKKVLKLLQKEAFGSAEGSSNKASNLEYVSRQIALV
jgi:hypothetical protein